MLIVIVIVLVVVGLAFGMHLAAGALALISTIGFIGSIVFGTLIAPSGEGSWIGLASPICALVLIVFVWIGFLIAHTHIFVVG